ncbi:MAG: hypothetical protein PHW53_03995 [Patescibacteria group bacterium]|nr:hypothetical protein [Patescibacteria group bacterium]
MLVGKYCVSIGRLASVFVLKPLHCPAVEFFRWLNFGQRFFDLFFQFIHLNAFLTARTFSFSAVIIGVVMDVAVFVFLYFILGRNHTAALAATNHAGVSESVGFRFWFAPMAE